MKNILPVEPEWMAVLDGDPIDLACWERALSAPHDPRCEHLPFNDGFIWTLRDDRFNASMTADEIKSDAITLIDQLNGALSTTDHAEPLKFRGVGRIGEDGKINIHIYAEVHACARSSVTATAESRDANGNLVPPLPSKPSLPQKWIKAAEENDDIADLLVFAGRADNWFDIYKTIGEC